MNDSLAISVQNISKKYRLFGSVKERFLEALHPFDKQYHHEFWALQDISFDVPKGSTVGIIGRNGSGKSTLLQIITSVLQPTSGHVKVDGKISALLELGSGFNPEVTGRENVLFQGEIMGFTRKEMIERLPAIEEFADIGEFIDQPVKIYSSGMFVRLAFAAAINVDPDILIIDEALAVGDVRFQKKCYDKIHEFMGKITVVIVTHDVQTINNLCDTSILIDSGKLIEIGEPKRISNLYINVLANEDFGNIADLDQENPKDKPEATEVEYYENERLAIKSSLATILKSSSSENEFRYGDRKSVIISCGVRDENFAETAVLQLNKHYFIYFRAYFFQDIEDLRVGFHISNHKGMVMYGVHSKDKMVLIPPKREGEIIEATFKVAIILAPGDYLLSFGITSSDSSQVYDRRIDALQIKVITNKLLFKPESLVDLNAEIAVTDFMECSNVQVESSDSEG